MRTIRLLRALFVAGWKEALAYRTELFVWILATTMPLVMLVLWRAVTEEKTLIGADGVPFGGQKVVAYFLATFLIRQLCGSWAAWQINQEIKDGTLALRLLRPVHPFLPWATEQLAYVPLRGAVALAGAGTALAVYARAELTTHVAVLTALPVSIFLAFICTFSLNLIFGSLAFWTNQSTKIMDAYNAIFFVFSGYLIPVTLFPRRLAEALDYLPFRYQLGVPVELLVSGYDGKTAWLLVAKQAVFAVFLLAGAFAAFHRGLRRFEAVGG